MPYKHGSVEAKFLAGDPEAHGQVVHWVARILTLPRFRMLRHERVDLGQEVLTRLVASLRAGRFDAAQEFRAYVQGIARFTAQEVLKQRLKRLNLEQEILDEPARTPQAERVDNEQLVSSVLTRIPEKCRVLFQLYFLEERSYAEVAKETNLAEGTVKSRLFRCLKQAHDLIEGTRE